MIARQETEEGTPKTFLITFKTTHEILQRNVRYFHSASFKEIITIDIINNARELTPEINEEEWGSILRLRSFNARERADAWSTNAYRGKWGIAKSIASTMASIAFQMGCDLHSPPIVYLCGYYFSSSLEKRVLFLGGQLERKRDFIDEEARQRTLENETRELESLKPLSQKLATSIDEYARQNQFAAGYIQVLQLLITLEAATSYDKNSIRNQVVGSLKMGKVEKALALARQHLPHSKKSP